METLTAASVKVLLENNHRDKEKGFFCPTQKNCVFSRSEIRSLGFQKHVNRGFSISVLIPSRKTVQPFSSASAMSFSETTETSAGDEEIQQIIDATQAKTVHVKFQLQKECSFGQQFLIVGDDPMFGLWDPSNAVPLNWSEGHVWSIELDMPCDKMIKYKFILKGGTDDDILWQPGTDRVLQTWETSKTITVSEDWENEELQIIEEEDPVYDKLTESLEDSAAMIVTENLPQPGGEDTWNDMNIKTNGTFPNLTEMIPLGEKPMAIVAENITEQNGGLEVEIYGISRERMDDENANKFVTLGAANTLENNAMSIRGENFTLAKEDEKDLDSDVGIPILVPGLDDPTTENDEEEIESSDASFGSEIAEEFSVPELKTEEETEMLLNDKQESQEERRVEDVVENSKVVEHNNDWHNKEMKNDVLGNDMQWGRRTLQRFLVTLGLL